MEQISRFAPGEKVAVTLFKVLVRLLYDAHNQIAEDWDSLVPEGSCRGIEVVGWVFKEGVVLGFIVDEDVKVSDVWVLKRSVLVIVVLNAGPEVVAIGVFRDQNNSSPSQGIVKKQEGVILVNMPVGMVEDLAKIRKLLIIWDGVLEIEKLMLARKAVRVLQTINWVLVGFS